MLDEAEPLNHVLDVAGCQMVRSDIEVDEHVTYRLNRRLDIVVGPLDLFQVVYP